MEVKESVVVDLYNEELPDSCALEIPITPDGLPLDDLNSTIFELSISNAGTIVTLDEILDPNSATMQ